MATVSAIVDGKEESKDKNNNPKLIQKSHEYAAVISKEINAIFRSVKTAYYKRFPELESIVTQPALYCKAVREIEIAEKG
jgi:RNA processing factor Prp31